MNSANKKPEWLKITTDYFWRACFYQIKQRQKALKKHIIKKDFRRHHSTSRYFKTACCSVMHLNRQKCHQEKQVRPSDFENLHSIESVGPE